MPIDADGLAGLDDEQFSELLRSNLVPREAAGPGRAAWDTLWQALRQDAVLADRAYEVLELFLDVTETALGSGSLDPATDCRRARKFADQCEMAWNRLDSDRDWVPPLQWAGERAAVHPVHSRHVIARLVGAIGRHRGAVLRTVGKPSEADADLWDTLRQIGLDPRDYPDQDPLTDKR